ncbi:UNKNOWN [Stylonychia lemnae]|uniref:ODAD1 central coiled coil region domain-containing protein n=1 Tax=Stylonychia lemnae TaxID=5949 RepID=A0A078AKW3_STYLE|nr:UNKNOWN [Stylonychia lemnae]|eukprot:CDW83010.1 UNKNOWN [Stylonychia lemnae]
MKKENALFKEELNLEGKSSMQSAGNIGSQIAVLQKFGDNYAKRIEKEKKKLDELNTKIKDVQQKIETQRRLIKDNQGQKESNEDVARKIKSLENRLDKQLQKFNQAVAQNKNLREQIDALRRERVVFDNIYKKLETELKKKKDDMMKIIERAEKAYMQREQAKKEMNDLKKEAEKEQEEFEKEWNKLGQLIEKDKQVKDFIKTQEESKAALQGTINHNNTLGDNKDLKSQRQENLNELTNTEKTLKKQVAQTGWGIARDTANIHLSMAKVQQYEEAFNSIKAATHLNDIDQLVTEFVQAEDHNYSLYKYVGELTNEMDELEDEIKRIREEIDKYRGHGVNNENNREKILDKLNKELAATENETKEYDKQYQETMKTINALKIGIQSIFDRIGCNTEVVPELIGATGVTESNMMHYLGVIEQRTNEVLQMYAACQSKGGFDSQQLPSGQLNVPQIGTNVGPQNNAKSGKDGVAEDKINLDAPDLLYLEDDEERKSDEDDTRRFTIKDFKEKAQKFVKDNFDKYAAKKKPKTKNGANDANLKNQ